MIPDGWNICYIVPGLIPNEKDGKLFWALAVLGVGGLLFYWNGGPRLILCSLHPQSRD